MQAQVLKYEIKMSVQLGDMQSRDAKEKTGLLIGFQFLKEFERAKKHAATLELGADVHWEVAAPGQVIEGFCCSLRLERELANAGACFCKAFIVASSTRAKILAKC